MRIVAIAALTCSSLAAQATQSVEGLWLGTLDAGAMKLRLAFHLTNDGNGTIDSLDQGAKGIPLTTLEVKGTHVSLTSKRLNGTYEAELLENGQKMQGIWKQGQPIALVMVRVTAIPEMNRPQTPKPPFPYKQEDVTYPSVDRAVMLAGTLTIPEGNGPFPGVVMITGSGPQDRDESILGHKPFWVIADYLSRHGIAVLRADDRGVGKSTGSFSSSTSADFANDAEGGVRYLKTRKEISRIGLIGHSEGAVIAPMLANRNPDVRFTVLLAGSAVRGDVVLLEQNRRLMTAMGLPDSYIQPHLDRLQKIFEAIRDEPDSKIAAEKARKALGPIDASLQPTVDAQIAQTASPWFHWFLVYDPGPALEKMKQPALVLNGSLDLQVPASQNIPVMREKLKANNNSRIELLPGLNHLFQHAKTGSPSEYSGIEETFAPEVLSVMAGWINGLR